VCVLTTPRGENKKPRPRKGWRRGERAAVPPLVRSARVELGQRRSVLLGLSIQAVDESAGLTEELAGEGSAAQTRLYITPP
jgi:hypothetical protein